MAQIFGYKPQLNGAEKQTIEERNEKTDQCGGNRVTVKKTYSVKLKSKIGRTHYDSSITYII